MVEETGALIAECFAALEDPRIDRLYRHIGPEGGTRLLFGKYVLEGEPPRQRHNKLGASILEGFSPESTHLAG